MGGTTLITGADGYVGSHVAARLLDAGDDCLVLAVRAADQAEFGRKRAGLVDRLGLGDSVAQRADQVRFVAADLRAADPFRDVDPASISRIVHAAAVTRLNVSHGDALAVNVAGTERMLSWARDCGGLERFALISTLYVAGRLAGTVTESPLPDSGFANHYEWSKWESERLALAASADLPVSVLRVPTVVAESDDGRVVQFNAFHNTLKLLFYGLLTVLPGDPATRVPIATADFVTDALGRLLQSDAPLGIVNIVPDMPRIATLRELVEAAFAVFGRDDRFRRRGLAMPDYYDSEQFATALGGVSGDAALSSSMGAVVPFAEQLCIRKEFANETLRANWPEYRAPDPLTLASAVTSYLVATRWGRHLEETA